MINKSLSILASEVPFTHEKSDIILETFFAVVDYYKKYPNPGACHLISSILYVLLREQGITNELCIGVVKDENGMPFDHSWIEINGEVFDIAIQRPLNGTEHSLVYASYELLTGEKHKRVYGISSLDLDNEAARAKNMNFNAYMIGYPHFKYGAWNIVKDIGKTLKLKLNIQGMVDTYSDTIRILKK